MDNDASLLGEDEESKKAVAGRGVHSSAINLSWVTHPQCLLWLSALQ